MALEPGTVLGPYRVARKLGAGGMGEVYAATDPRLGREVAIKVLHKDMVRDAESLRRFQQEANTVAALNHTNIVQIFDVGSTEDGSPFLVMELLDGESLRERMDSKPMPLRKVAEICVQLARALGAAHAKGIVHRDLKPENVYLIKQGPAKILDFGLAKLSTREEALVEGDATRALFTKPGMIIGTVGYMAPEQVEGHGADSRTDIFALGVIMWEMLSGSRPFRKDSSIDTLHAILRDDPPEIPPDLGLPASIERILRRCLEKNPDDRFQSAYDLAFQLESLSIVSGSANTVRMSAVTDAAEGQTPWYRTPHRLFYPLPIKLPAKLKVCFWDRAQLSVAYLLVAAAAVMLLMTAFGHPPVDLKSGREFAKSFRPAMDATGNIQSAAVSRDGSQVLASIVDEAGKTNLVYQKAGQSATTLDNAPAEEVQALSNTGSALLRNPEGDLYLQVMDESANPLKIATRVLESDLTPDGSKVALLQRSGDRFTVQFPQGVDCYSTQHRLRDLKISPKGDALAFFERDSNLNLFHLRVWRKGGLETWKGGKDLCPKGAFAIAALRGLAWNLEGDGLYVSVRGDLLGLVRNHGGEILHRNAGSVRLLGATQEGPLLAVGTELVMDRGRLPDSSKETDLDWIAGTLNAISDDGSKLLVTRDNEIWLLPSNRSRGRKIGTGTAQALSPDGKLVLFTDNERILGVPAEGGDLQIIATQDELKKLGFTFTGDSSDPKFALSVDGKWILALQKQVLARKAMNGGAFEPVQAPMDGFASDWRMESAFSPDGQRLALQIRESGEQRWCLVLNLETKKQEARTRLQDGERLLAWQKEGSCLVFHSSKGRAEFRALDPKTGQRRALFAPTPHYSNATARFRNLHCSADGAYYAYRHATAGLSQLMIGKGF
ncbi:MAG: serine/threonine-protein kinase [Holophagaceae bacterium]|nr:serine/threonine-protein kinase [Holophagaceae bacterium]